MKLFFTCFLWIAAFNSKAQFTEKIETDRPDQTESPFTVPKNYLQFESGFNLEQEAGAGVTSTTFLHPTLLSKYGLGNKIELRLITTLSNNKISYYNYSKFQTTLEPVAIGCKIQLLQERGVLPKTSLIFHAGLPQVATGYAKEEIFLAPDFRFTMQHSLSDVISLGYNLGAEWEPGASDAKWIYTLTSGFNISEKWYGYIESFGFIGQNQLPQHQADAGFGYTPGNNIKLDVSGGVGLNPEAPDWYIAMGFSARLKLKK